MIWVTRRPTRNTVKSPQSHSSPSQSANPMSDHQSQAQYVQLIKSTNGNELLISEAQAAKNFQWLKTKQPDFKIRSGNSWISLHSKVFLQHIPFWGREFKKQSKNCNVVPTFDFQGLNIMDLIDVAYLLCSGTGTIQIGTFEAISKLNSILDRLKVPAVVREVKRGKMNYDWENPKFRCHIDGRDYSKCSDLFNSFGCEETLDSISDGESAAGNSPPTSTNNMSKSERNTRCKCEICGMEIEFLNTLVNHMKSQHLCV